MPWATGGSNPFGSEVDLSEMQQIATARLIGNISGGTAVPSALTLAQVLAFLGTGTPGASNFLRGDGAWATAGKILQVVSTFSSAVQTGTTAIPADDTIPQNTEGDQFFSLAITPQASNSTLLFIGSVALGTSNSSALVAAMFVDSTADAIGVWTTYVGTTGFANSMPILMSVSAASTNARTYKLRCGSSIGTTTLNGWGGARKFGGVYQSGFAIIEVAA